MKRFFQISIPAFLLLLAAGSDAFARYYCAGACISVSVRRNYNNEKIYYPPTGWASTQTMSEKGRDKEEVFEKLESRCDGRNEVLVVGPVFPGGPNGSLVLTEANEDNACVRTSEINLNPAPVVPASFETRGT